jgi:hypothetical protein
MPKLVVTAEKLPWGRDVLLRGATFEASEKHAKLLKAMGKAADYTEPQRPAHVDTMKAPARTEAESPDPLTEARQRYLATTGKRAFMGWSLQQINDKIAGYKRRDMRAEE